MRCGACRLLALLLWLPASLPCLGADAIPKDLKLPASVTLAICMPVALGDSSMGGPAGSGHLPVNWSPAPWAKKPGAR